MNFRRWLVVLLVGAAMLVAGGSGNASASEMQLSTDSRGNYRVQVMSWWEIPFRSVVRQQYDYSCGSAAIATLLTFHYGHEISEWESFQSMWEAGDQEAIKKLGFSMLEMKTFLEKVGYQVEGYRLAPEELASLERPSIVLFEDNGFKHFVVLKGVRDGRVVVGDPMVGLKTYSLEEISRVWNGIALAIVSSPSRATPTYNAARDWDPWSTAPVSEVAGPDMITDMTTHLPPIYQLTPNIYIDTPL